MFRFSKLFKGEIKKIFYGPSMFIMTTIFLLLLVVLPKFFSPINRVSNLDNYSLSYSSVKDMYSNFNTYKNNNDSNLSILKDDLNFVIERSENLKENLTKNCEELNQNYTDYKNELSNQEPNLSNCLILQNAMQDTVIKIKNEYDDYLNKHFSPLIFVNESLDYELNVKLVQLQNILNSTNKDKSEEYFLDTFSQLKDLKLINSVSSLVKNIEKISFNVYEISNLLNEFESKNEYLNNLKSDIQELYTNSQQYEDGNINKINIQNIGDKILHYLSTQTNLITKIENTAIISLSKNYKDSYLSQFVGYENFNSYLLREKITKSNFLLNNNILDENIASTFSFGVNTSETTNAFDYLYFALEIQSIFIVAFVVIIGAGMIAKEHSEGTIKLLAIRPYSRNKIMLSKILATILVAFIFLAVGVFVSFIAGSIIYGASIQNMLIILNSNLPIVLPNILVMLIYLLLLFVKIIFYAMLAIMISTLIKSFVVSVLLSSGIYILNLILTFVTRGASWLKFNIFANLDVFKYFGGSFSNLNISNNPINMLFSSSVFQDTNIFIPIIILILSIFVFSLTTFITFKKRDIS